MADKTQVNTSTDNAEKSNSEYLIQQVIDSSQASINKNKSNDVLLELVKDISNGNMDRATARLEAFEKLGKCNLLQLYEIPAQQGETLLHLAIRSQDNIEFVKKLSTLCPDLLLMGREQSQEFCGQTALHMAITKGNKEAIKAMLKVGRKSKKFKMSTLLNICATGSRFVNTVMMGQLPLTVAALGGDTGIVDLLIKYGADLHTQNKEEDTVFHSLVKYAATYPEKVIGVIQMVRHIHIKINSDFHEYLDTEMHRHTYSFLWFLKNKDNLTPLQLAAKHGVTELFAEILNIKDVYCYISANDGLFDVKEYDVTEIDTVSIIRLWQSQKQPKSISRKIQGISRNVLQSNETSCSVCCSYPETESILEMLFRRNYDSKDAYRIIELPPVQYIIKTKWSTYQRFFFSWMILHYAFMALLTIFSVYNVELGFPSAHGNNATTLSKEFVYGFRWVSLGAGVFYGFIAICLLIAKFRKTNIKDYIKHNLEYIIPMMILSITLIIDVLWSIVEDHDSIPIIIALISGWWLNIFFLSPFQEFSFFTELIKRVITGDLIRFGLVILFGLFSFTAGMYIVFRGTDKEDFLSYGRTMMAMLKLGIGIDDIGVLYSARNPGAAITIFIVFTTFTYILMLNALIAMMSQTCSSVSEDRFPLWRIQQLSVILVIEDIMCLCCFQNILSSAGIKKEVRGLDPITKQRKYEDRYFLEIHSLQMEYATAEEKNRVQKKTNDSYYFANVIDSVVANNELQKQDKKAQMNDADHFSDDVDSVMTKNEVQMHDKETQTLQDNKDNKKCKRKKSNTKTPRSSLNMVDGVMTNNGIISSRIPVGSITEIDVDKEIPLLNAGIEPPYSWTKNIRKEKVSPEEPDARRKNKKLSSTSQKKKYLSESDSEIQDQLSANMNSSTRTMFLARSQQRSLKPQRKKEQLTCEIRTLTDH